MAANWQSLTCIGIGGALGAMLRFLLSEQIYWWLGRGFPWGTLAVNVVGSFLMGLAAVLLVSRFAVSLPLRQGFLVGFLGALTTYSSFAMDKWQLFNQGQLIRASLYFLLTAVACMAALLLGNWLAQKLA